MQFFSSATGTTGVCSLSEVLRRSPQDLPTLKEGLDSLDVQCSSNEHSLPVCTIHWTCVLDADLRWQA